MGTKFLSHRAPGRTGGPANQVGAAEVGLEGRDHQQALVLDALRRAAGAPVSYGELRQAGVELPASVVTELELAGVAIERCAGEQRGVVGVRLDPAKDPGARPTSEAAERPVATDAEPETAWSSVRIHRASRLQGIVLTLLGGASRPTGEGSGTERHRGTERGQAAPGRLALPPATNTPPVRGKAFGFTSRRRVLTVAAVLAGIAVVFAFVAMWAPGRERGTRVAVVKRPHAPQVVAAGAPRRPGAPRSTHPSPAVPVSPVLATELEAQGHSLLESGQYGDAVPVLKRAALATGETVGACLEPASSTCLTYAYALYDLGRAVRLSGEPQAAVSILERRLQIDNQRSTVVAELQLARQGIG